MSIYTTAIKYEPEYETPEDDVLNAIAVDDTFEKSVALFHTGLKNVTMKGVYRERSGEQMTVGVQKFKLKGAGMNKKPSIGDEELSRLFTYVAQQHCNAIKVGEVVYRCYFYGDNDELGRGFQKNKSFRLRPQDEPEADGNEDDDDDDADAPGSALMRGPRGSAHMMMGGRSVEDQLITVMRIQADQSKQLQEDARENLRQARHDHTAALHSVGAAWENIVTSANTIIDKLGNEVDHARKEASNANARLVKISEERAKAQENEKNILQYAMDMFTKAMQTQWSGLSRDMQWERQIMYQQFDALAAEGKKDTRRGWVKDFSPLLLAVAGQVISAAGNKAQGDLMQKLAQDQMDSDEDEEDEDDEDEDDDATEEAEAPPRPSAPQRPPAAPRPSRPVVDVEARDAPNLPMGVPAGTDPAKFLAENPIASLFQLFGNMLQEEGRLPKLSKIMGPQIFEQLNQAVASSDDAAARTRGTQLLSAIMMKPGMKAKIDKQLSDEQRELLGDLSKKLFGSEVFPPKPTVPKPTVPKPKTVAKPQDVSKPKPKKAKRVAAKKGGS